VLPDPAGFFIKDPYGRRPQATEETHFRTGFLTRSRETVAGCLWKGCPETE
jgi:hypothetical protein